MPDPNCKTWIKEATGLRKELMEVQDWEALKLAVDQHTAVCVGCQEYEARVFSGKAGEMTARLYMHIAEAVEKSMAANSFPIQAEMETIAVIGMEVTKVLEKWKLVKFEENMIAVREEWAARTLVKCEREEADGRKGS